MRYLDRAAVHAPACLARYDYTRQTWKDVTYADKEEIRTQLGVLQKNHCAYCEGDIRQESSKPHIEHFEQRDPHHGAPEKTFVWDNLFWSCSHKDCCGIHKDRVVKTYKQPGVLLKPDVDEPRHYLFFGSDGNAEPRAGLNAEGGFRAKETIRVFALNNPRLVQMRKAYCEGPRSLLEEALKAGWTAEEMVELLKDDVALYANLPFSSAALDALDMKP